MLQIIPLAALGLQIATAVVFVLAGSTKLANPVAIRRTISVLGIPRSTELAAVLGTLELGAGLALMLLPGQRLTALFVAILALLFGGAAGFAIIRNISVDCACLGSIASAPLGWRQLALTVVWLGSSVSIVTVPVALPSDRLALAVVVNALIAIFTLSQLRPLIREHKIQCAAIEGS
jgi:hypothetical protein